MNTKILQKCVEELSKENFKKDYVLGMLETVIEMSSQNQSIVYETNTSNIKQLSPTNNNLARTETVSDEEIFEGKYLGNFVRN